MIYNKQKRKKRERKKEEKKNHDPFQELFPSETVVCFIFFVSDCAA